MRQALGDRGLPDVRVRPTPRPGDSRARFLLPAIILLAAGLMLAGCSAAPAPEAAATAPAEARAHTHMTADPPEWDAARAAFLEAAEQGSPTAMSYLGWMYEEGHGVAVDGERAAHWYARAARAGAHDYAMKLGWMYLGGQGVAQDRAQADDWFGFAIEAGHVPAHVAYASVLISDALGGREPARVFEARTLLETALAHDYRLAAQFLARLHMEGIGGHPVDPARAAHYAHISAHEGNAQMQGWLAYLYAEGEGVDRDPVIAAKWANLAAAGGDGLGNSLRLELEAALSPEQAQAARELAVRWALEHR
jgi:TPR repeat protein